MPNAVESILAVFLMSLGDVGFIWEGVEETNHEIIGKIHFFIFIAIVVILLLNLLIAMMGDTYAKIAEIKNEWMRQVSPLREVSGVVYILYSGQELSLLLKEEFPQRRD